jgi:nucleoside 2-deoxyribosyltransferase
MSRGSVYLAGPIRYAGGFEEATAWRNDAYLWLNARNIDTYSPMRAKDYAREMWPDVAAGDGSIKGNVLSAPSGIVARDRFDVLRCDLVLANLTGTTRASLGTAIEFGWADANQIPVVLVARPGEEHYHAMLTEIAGWVVPTLDEALAVIDAVL